MDKGAGRAFLQAGKLEGTCRGLGRMAQILCPPDTHTQGEGKGQAESEEGSCYAQHTSEAEGVTHWEPLSHGGTAWVQGVPVVPP